MGSIPNRRDNQRNQSTKQKDNSKQHKGQGRQVLDALGTQKHIGGKAQENEGGYKDKYPAKALQHHRENDVDGGDHNNKQKQHKVFHGIYRLSLTIV